MTKQQPEAAPDELESDEPVETPDGKPIPYPAGPQDDVE